MKETSISKPTPCGRMRIAIKKAFFQIINGVENPGEGFDKEMNQKILDAMMEMAPSVLENLTVINR